jgi:hypothetical protein
MAGGLKGPLGSALSAAGHTLSTLHTDSTHTAVWAANNYPARLVSQYQPALLLVALGTNDISKQRPTSETASAARQIVAAAAGRRVMWIGPPSGPSHISRDRGTIQALISSGAEYFDSRTLPLSFYDGVHPTTAGFQAWARAIAARVGSGATFPSMGLPVAVTTPNLSLIPADNLSQYNLTPFTPTATGASMNLFDATPPESDEGGGAILLLLLAMFFFI